MKTRGIWLAVLALGCSSGETFSSVSAPQVSGGAGGEPVSVPGCTQGDTRACLGPGACESAQACGSDGLWSGCECAAESGGAGGSAPVLNPYGCPGEQLSCDGFCTDSQTDTVNCGECGKVCDVGRSVCRGGECVCLEQYTDCGEGSVPRCADLLTDESHCGACPYSCALGGECLSGQCVYPD